MVYPLIVVVFSFLMIESSEDSSEVVVFVCHIAINLVWVNILGKVFKDVDWIFSIGLGIPEGDCGINCLFFEVEGDFMASSES